MENDKKIIEEQFFKYECMSYEEMKFYLNNIIKNCKDICDSINTVDGKTICDIVDIVFRKNNNLISFNGFLSIGSENRCIDGIIYEEKCKYIVDMHITRLCVECENKEYRVVDEFFIEKNQLKRRSFYNYNMESSYETIEDKKMKGRLL